MSPFGRTGRFASAWATGRPTFAVHEVMLRGPDGRAYPTTRYAPPGLRTPTGAWIVLHGLTRTGRHHASLVGFVQALAASGTVVVVPEIAAWRGLDLDTEAARDAVLAALVELRRDPDVTGDPGLMGFSFGGPQVLRLAADSEIGPGLAGAAAFGGYGDLESTLRFQMTGRIVTTHGVEDLRPDPYARWIVGANFLPHVPGEEHTGPVAEALRALAMTSGERGIPGRDPVYDSLKAELRRGLIPDLRALFDLFAPPSTRDPVADHPDVEAWVAALAAAARRRAPGLELPPGTRLHAPAHILHGRFDTLVPFTEAALLASRIENAPTPTITRLFAHSARESGLELTRPDRWARELLTLGRALRGVLRIPG